MIVKGLQAQVQQTKAGGGKIKMPGQGSVLGESGIEAAEQVCVCA